MREAREVIEKALCDTHCMCGASTISGCWVEGPPRDLADAILAALAAAGLAVVPLCSCPQRAEVASAAREHGPNSAERWRLCGEPRCPAVEGSNA